MTAEEAYLGKEWIVDLIQVASIWTDAFRWFGWLILKGLGQLLDKLYDGVTGMMRFNLLNIQPIKDLVDIMTPLAWALLTLSLLVGAIIIFVNPKGSISEFLRSMMLSVILIIAMPVIFTGLDSVKVYGINDMDSLLNNTQSNTSSIGKDILTSLTWDVHQSSTYGCITKIENINPYYLDVNKRLAKEGDFNFSIASVDNNGKITAKELGDGFFGMGEEFLYAYQFDFISMFLMLCVTMLGLFFAGLKIAGLLFDLVFKKIICSLVLATDLHGSGRSKKMIQSIISTYVVFLVILLLLKIYLDINKYIATNDSLNTIVKLFLIAGSVKGLIDGPDLIVQLLGIDAGVKSAAGGLLSMYGASQVARGVGKVVSAPKKAAKAVSSATRSLASGAGKARAITDISKNFKAGQNTYSSGSSGFESGREVSSYVKNTAANRSDYTQGKSSTAGFATGAGFAYEKIKTNINNYPKAKEQSWKTPQKNDSLSKFKPKAQKEV